MEGKGVKAPARPCLLFMEFASRVRVSKTSHNNMRCLKNTNPTSWLNTAHLR